MVRWIDGYVGKWMKLACVGYTRMIWMTKPGWDRT